MAASPANSEMAVDVENEVGQASVPDVAMGETEPETSDRNSGVCVTQSRC